MLKCAVDLLVFNLQGLYAKNWVKRIKPQNGRPGS